MIWFALDERRQVRHVRDVEEDGADADEETDDEELAERQRIGDVRDRDRARGAPARPKSPAMRIGLPAQAVDPHACRQREEDEREELDGRRAPRPRRRSRRARGSPTSGSASCPTCEPNWLIVSAGPQPEEVAVAPEPAVSARGYAWSTGGGGSGCRRSEQRVRERVARPVRIVRALEVGDQAVHPLLEPTLLLRREPDVDERRRVLLVARRDELVGRLPQHHGREHAAAQLVRHRLVALQHEESCDASVVLLRQRAHLPRADDANEPGRLEHLQVVADRALRGLERGRELGRARRALAQQHHDARAERVAERAKLLRVLDDEDVVELVVRVTVDDRGTYGKSRPFASVASVRRRGTDRGRGRAR